MSTPDDPRATFTGLVDLASATFGGRAVASSDDFFAGCENLVKPEPAVFLPDEFTERGKWMDGWESRRKRCAGHDWCILELGMPGVIRGLDVDTAHFLGNHPPFASIEATRMPRGSSDDELMSAPWTEILAQAPLRPGAQNLFSILDGGVYTHVRLNIFPDGGVARLRVYGDVEPDWSDAADDETTPRLEAGEVDLAAVRNGGLALACSDMFFGPMNNLIAPGRAANMGGGWESRRRRDSGHDWILLRLGARGRVGLVEIDTAWFKGNYPDRCRIEGIDAGDARITDLLQSSDWQPVLGETPLRADERKFVRDEVQARGPFTHLRLSIYPDGGVSRLRVWGQREA